MRKTGILIVIFLSLICTFVVSARQPAPDKPAPPPKRVTLTDVQVKMLLGFEQEIEAIPEVKALRAKQQAFMAGIATSNGLTRWTWRVGDKGGVTVEEVPEPEKGEERKP